MYKKECSTDFHLNKLILETEGIAMMVIDKNTSEVMYINEQMTNIFPNLIIGNNLNKDEIINKLTIVGHSGYYKSNNELMQNNQNWLFKNNEIIYNGVVSYMIYGKDTKEYIDSLENFDTLTNSLSYVGFQKYYYNVIKQNNYNYGLCTIDIDKFKYINNLFGFETGNKILNAVAITLQSFLNSNDETFCRVNEDKFAMFLKFQNIDELETRIENLKIAFLNMKENHFKDKKLAIAGGIHIIDKNKDLHRNMDKANIARKTSKGFHESKFRFYDESLKANSKKEKRIEEGMLQAVKNDEFVPYLQAKFNIATNEICGAEALVRWIAPEGKIFPDEFIPIFEKNGFITTLDFVMYEKILSHIRMCLDKNIDICPISLNVSRGHVKYENFSDRFMSLVKKYNIPLELIELEVTESAFVEEKSSLKYFIGKLKEYNIKVSIDDFGTAYSSLNVLKDVDIDVLKIDKDFLKNINFVKVTEIPTKDKVIIKHIVSMANELGFHTICEGIETREQLEFLREIGCELGQGYLFAKPMPIESFMHKFYDENWECL